MVKHWILNVDLGHQLPLAEPQDVVGGHYLVECVLLSGEQRMPFIVTYRPHNNVKHILYIAGFRPISCGTYIILEFMHRTNTQPTVRVQAINNKMSLVGRAKTRKKTKTALLHTGVPPCISSTNGTSKGCSRHHSRLTKGIQMFTL